MKLKIDIKYLQSEYTEKELNVINDIFGIFTKNVYFNLNVDEYINENYKFINFCGISGSGKTVIKEHIKKQLTQEGKTVLDFDDIDNFDRFNDMNIMELFNITSGNDEILKILNAFGLFEMRLLLTNIGTLSQGQRTRLKYIYLFNNIEENETYLLIDEFLTFVDTLTSINFARGIVKFLKNKNIKLFTFGVNAELVGQFEDITYYLGNSNINAIIENGKIIHKSADKVKALSHEKINELSNNEDLMDDW